MGMHGKHGIYTYMINYLYKYLAFMRIECHLWCVKSFDGCASIFRDTTGGQFFEKYVVSKNNQISYLSAANSAILSNFHPASENESMSGCK